MPYIILKCHGKTFCKKSLDFVKIGIEKKIRMKVKVRLKYFLKIYRKTVKRKDSHIISAKIWVS